MEPTYRFGRQYCPVGFEWLDDVQGGDPSCSDALSADSRCVRAHTTDLAVSCEATSKLGASRALRLTIEQGRSRFLVCTF